MKLTNDVLTELTKIRSAVDDAYTKLNVVLYDKVLAAKTTYKQTNPSEKVTDNFRYIAEKIKSIQESEVIGEE